MTFQFPRFRSVATVVAAMSCLAAAGFATEEAIRVPQPTAMSNVVNKVSPSYPPVARQLRLTGDVEVDVTINTDGKVEDAKVVKGNSVFSAATVDAVKKWEFRPFQVQGKISKVATTLVFSFKP